MDFTTLINKDNLSRFAYLSSELCPHPRALAVEFHGMGQEHMYSEAPPAAIQLAEYDILYLYPYNSPWSFMNDTSVRFTDRLVEVALEIVGDPALPLIYAGASMGGMSSLSYCVTGRYKPIACFANCPVCDLVYFYDELHDRARALISAFGHYEGSMEEALMTVSPLHLVDRMPKIPYYIFHCIPDPGVSIVHHSDRLVAALKNAGHEVHYTRVPDRGHCDLGEELLHRYYELMGELLK
ncbi:MAG: hypothetical protein IJA85_06890 [Clostridia bacterium]|nr:hypothetical protein [Clostridia bacterium]